MLLLQKKDDIMGRDIWGMLIIHYLLGIYSAVIFCFIYNYVIIFKGLFNRDNFISGYEGTSSNWAKGFYTDGCWLKGKFF